MHQRKRKRREREIERKKLSSFTQDALMTTPMEKRSSGKGIQRKVRCTYTWWKGANRVRHPERPQQGPRCIDPKRGEREREERDACPSKTGGNAFDLREDMLGRRFPQSFKARKEICRLGACMPAYEERCTEEDRKRKKK